MGFPDDNLQTLKRVFYGVLAAVVLLEFVLVGIHIELSLEHIAEFPAFHAVYGFISCILLVFTVKFVGHKWLMREEDYYD